MDEFVRAKTLLARKLSCKSYLSHELLDWLKKKGISEEISKKAIETFSQDGYIDDESWALSEARRFSAKGKGKRWLSFHLSQKQLPAPLIEKALRNYSSDPTSLIKKRLKNDFSDINIRKAANYLYGRGFNSSEIEAAIEKIKSE
jgi:SOS response regulatory protein OraA/RecX